MANLVAQRGDEIIRRLPAGPVIGVEVGVYDGRLSEYLLACRDDLTLYMVDRWKEVGVDHRYRRSNSQIAQGGQHLFDAAYDRTQSRTRRYRDRAVMVQGESVSVALRFRNNLDFVFIDADHSYEGVREDIIAWFPKLKPGGLLCGHDWDHPDHAGEWGVREAVEEFVVEHPEYTIVTGRNRTWFLEGVPCLT